MRKSFYGASNFFRPERPEVMGCITLHSKKKNMTVTLTEGLNSNFKLIKTISSGNLGLRGHQRSSKHAAEALAKEISPFIRQLGLSPVSLRFRAHHFARYTFLKSLLQSRIAVSSVAYDLPVPFGGCRPKKPRRT